jgi:hypothetical protein
MIYIEYETELVHDYIKELNSCHDLPSLQTLLLKYSEISPDLGEVKMNTQEDFDEFRSGLLLERQGKSAGEEWCKKYSSIAIQVDIIANKYGVPWGAAYLQMSRSLQSDTP